LPEPWHTPTQTGSAPMPSGLRAAAAAGLAAAVIGVVGLAATTGPPLSTRPLELPADVRLPTAPPLATSDPDAPIRFSEAVERAILSFFQVASILVLIGVVLLAVLLLLRTVDWLRLRLARRRDAGRLTSYVSGEAVVDEENEDDEELADEVRAGIAALDDEAAPTDAILACWLRLERVAATFGVARDPADTPTDLVVRLLGAHDVRRETLVGLATLYERARYSPTPLDESARAEARAALQAIEADLRGVRA
jgi:Domain of unknown function (DUF4129)